MFSAVGEDEKMAAVVGNAWSDVLCNLVRKFDFIGNAGALRKLYKPLYIEDRQVGLVRPNVLEHLAKFPQVFIISNDRVDLHPALQTYDERSERVNDVLQELRRQKCLKTLSGWRNECYEVRPNFEDTPLMKMDRCATCLFGIKQYGVDINGYVRNGKNGDSVWIQRRAYDKQTWPGKLDNMVSGGVAVGFTIMDTVKKEAEEEASIPPYLLERLTPAGAVTFYFEDDRGLFLETEFVFDLELPADFVPVNADGEVEDFQLVTIDELKEKVVCSEFKTTSCPVTLDFLVRHGHITAQNEPNYDYICEKLHMPIHNFFNTSNGHVFVRSHVVRTVVCRPFAPCAEGVHGCKHQRQSLSVSVAFERLHEFINSGLNIQRSPTRRPPGNQEVSRIN